VYEKNRSPAGTRSFNIPFRKSRVARAKYTKSEYAYTARRFVSKRRPSFGTTFGRKIRRAGRKSDFHARPTETLSAVMKLHARCTSFIRVLCSAVADPGGAEFDPSCYFSPRSETKERKKAVAAVVAKHALLSTAAAAAALYNNNHNNNNNDNDNDNNNDIRIEATCVRLNDQIYRTGTGRVFTKPVFSVYGAGKMVGRR